MAHGLLQNDWTNNTNLCLKNPSYPMALCQ